MKVVKKDKSKEFKNSETCIATEYPLGDKDINVAFVRILNDRYPQKGWAVNEVCKEMIYLVRGNVRLVTEEKSVELGVGDVALIEPKEKYYFEGDCEMVIPCSPAWRQEQHKIIDA